MSRIVFKEITLRNFLSYGNNTTIIDLERPGTTLIIGEDLDNTSNGKGGNGVGKSTILNALVYALYDQTISDISKDNLINNINKKNMEVTLKFIGDDGVQYLIKRERGMKVGASGNNVYLFINGEDKTPDSAAATNAKIAQIIGVPYELFVRIVVFSATHIPFLDLKTAQQTEITEELFGLTAISIKAEMLKKIIKDTKDSVTIKKVKIDSLIAEHERHTLQVDGATKRVLAWEVQHESAIEQLKDFDPINSINYSGQISSLQTEINDLRTTTNEEISLLRDHGKQQATQLRESIKEQISKLRLSSKQQTGALSVKKLEDTESLITVNEQYSTLLAEKVLEQTTIKQEIKTLTNAIEQCEVDNKKLTAELAHLQDNTCPYCHQSFAESTKKINEITGQIKQLQVDITNCNLDINKLTNQLSAVQSEVTSTKLIISENKIKIDTINAAAAKAISEIEDNIGTQITDIESKIDNTIKTKDAEIETTIKTITSESNIVIGEKTVEVEKLRQLKLDFDKNLTKYTELKDAVNPYIDPLDELIALKPGVIDYTDINNLTKEQDHQEFLLKLLTKKDSFIRKALLNKNIPLLNSRLRHYLLHLGLPHKVEFTKELSATISQFGRPLDFGNLSAGQRARVNFALSLAFRDVLQNLHPKINICVLDEVLDTALDGVGVQLAAKLIKQKAREEELSMYVISHREEVVGIFDKQMIIQLKDGFSSIKPDDTVNTV